MSPSYTIELAESELVVLSAVLAGLTGSDDFESLVADEADRQAVYNLVALLERVDPIVLARPEDYAMRLAAARESLLGDG